MELQNTHIKRKTRTSWTVYDNKKKCKLSDKSKDRGRTGDKQVQSNENNEM